MFMKIEHPERLAKLVFDDRDYGINQKNAHAITNFLLALWILYKDAWNFW